MGATRTLWGVSGGGRGREASCAGAAAKAYVTWREEGGIKQKGHF